MASSIQLTIYLCVLLIFMDFIYLLWCDTLNKFYKSLRRDKNKRYLSLSGEGIAQIIKMVVDLPLSARLVGDLHGVTASRVCQLVKYYRTNGVYPVPQKRGSPAAVVNPSLRLEILSAKANHAFEEYCRKRGIKHILCKYNHPPSNGKMEIMVPDLLTIPRGVRKP